MLCVRCMKAIYACVRTYTMGCSKGAGNYKLQSMSMYRDGQRMAAFCVQLIFHNAKGMSLKSRHLPLSSETGLPGGRKGEGNPVRIAYVSSPLALSLLLGLGNLVLCLQSAS